MGLNKRLISAAAAAGSNAVNTENFAPVLYSGNGTSSGSLNPITNVGFQPDLVWIKNRDNANSNFWTDSVRGAGNYLLSNTTDAQDSTSRFNSFDSDGFTVSTDTALLNNSSYDYVAWCWKAGGTAVSNTDGSITSSVSANPDAGFSIVKYSASGSTGTIGHGLSQAPEMIITKRTDASAIRPWRIGHDGLGSWDRYLGFNANAYGTSSTIFSAAPTSTVFSIGNDPSMINDTIAYCFHSVDGYQKLGTYTATGSAGSPTVTTGFQPRFLMVKNIDKNQEWIIVDSARNNGANSLRPDSSAAENTAGDNAITLGSTGFTIAVSGSGVNYQAGDTFIYLAIA